MTRWSFGFASGPISADGIFAQDRLYSGESGYGFEPQAGEGSARSFSVAVPEGNYRVTVTIGHATEATDVTIKAELRRLMLEAAQTKPGEFVNRSFVVNVRRPTVSTIKGGEVKLKPRERESEWLAWDEKLTLEFCGLRPHVAGVVIEKVDVPTIYILGDSTVADQPREPWASWGQMLPRWFNADIAIANHAESGESLSSSRNANRFEKVMSLIKPGDTLILQFGHNDMKQKGEGIGAFTSYKSELKRWTALAKQRGANVILVTSCERKAGVASDTLGDYPEAVRQAGREENVPVIDLHAASKTFYKSLGANLDRAFQDGTHHNNYGAYELARIIATGIRQNNLEIAKYLVEEFKPFHPENPDDVNSFHIAPSAATSTAAPLGS